jgi:pimeloyl-ACP methyl ester carboxylesterase
MHGGLGGSEYFKPIINKYTQRYRVLLIDRRGHGKSYDNDKPYSYESMADDMKEFLDYLKIDSALVVGFSDGGIVGFHLAGKYPGRVKKLVAIGANYLVSGMTEESLAFMQSRMTPENIKEEFPEFESNYRLLNPRPENFDSFLRKSRDLWLSDPYVQKERMTKIDAPVLLVLGDKDAVTIEHALEIHSLLKESNICVLPNASHFFLVEKPELIHPIILDFLND